MSVIEEKKALRTYIRQTERTLDPAYKAESSEAICRCVLALEEYRAAGTVFAFAGTVHEIDTSPLLKETLAAGKTLVLPRCAEGHALDLCVVTSMDELVPGMYGILEPKADCALVTPADIDFAVVPCLSFDRRGRRLGQGGGYYDRLLPQLACPTCLICRERLMSEAVPTEEHDRRCTLYVTERGVMEPEAQDHAGLAHSRRAGARRHRRGRFSRRRWHQGRNHCRGRSSDRRRCRARS